MKKSISLFLLLFVVLNVSASKKTRTLHENELKSLYIFSICKFTRWSRQPESPDNPIIISILGRTEPESEIVIPKNKRAHKREIIIRKIKDLEEISDSHVLFITAAEAYRIDGILDYIADKDILSVADTEGFGEKGVIINFFMENKKLRFEINREAEKKSSIKLHSQLFTIGKLVKSAPKVEKVGGK